MDSKPRNNPYQILIFAGLFFVPALFLLFHHGPAAVAHGGSRTGGSTGIDVQPEEVVHGYGVALLIMALAILSFYFYLRWQIRRDDADTFPGRRRRR